jgi:hypothetical protein
MFEGYNLSDIFATIIILAFVLLVCSFQVTFHDKSESAKYGSDSSLNASQNITFNNGTKETANRNIITVLPYWEYSWWNFLQID